MNHNATITLNGKVHPVSVPLTVSGLLDSLGMRGKPVVVELDETAVLPREFPVTPVADGSRVEIVVLAAGG